MTVTPIAELEELLAKATPGPWELDVSGDIIVAGSEGGVGYPPRPGTIASFNDGEYIENPNMSDAALIVAAVNALPELLSTLSTLSARGWQDISVKPDAPTMAVLFYGNGDHAPGWSAKEPVRDERFDLAYFNNGEWYQCGTGHEVFEAWADECGHIPTHWLAITAPSHSHPTNSSSSLSR